MVQLRSDWRELRSEGSGRELTFATPPTWTDVDNAWEVPCMGEWPNFLGRQHESPWDRDHMKDKEAAELCAGCPILETCLEQAMEEERGVIARHRYGIRGGLTPKGRAMLAAERRGGEGRVCPKHGPMSRIPSKPNQFYCQGCNSDRKKRQYAERRDEFKRSRVSCLLCQREIVVRGLGRHLTTVHGEEKAA